jgi:large subunit ribosomal protein L38e
MTKLKLNPLLKVKIKDFKILGVIIKTKSGKTKFKLRCPRFLYTLKMDDSVKAEKIKSSIPSSKLQLNLHLNSH